MPSLCLILHDVCGLLCKTQDVVAMPSSVYTWKRAGLDIFFFVIYLFYLVMMTSYQSSFLDRPNFIVKFCLIREILFLRFSPWGVVGLSGGGAGPNDRFLKEIQGKI